MFDRYRKDFLTNLNFEVPIPNNAVNTTPLVRIVGEMDIDILTR